MTNCWHNVFYVKLPYKCVLKYALVYFPMFASNIGIYSIACDILENYFCLALGITPWLSLQPWVFRDARDPLHVDRIPGAPKHSRLERERREVDASQIKVERVTIHSLQLKKIIASNYIYCS